MAKGKRANIRAEGEAIIVAHALEYPRLQRTALAEKLQKEFKSRRYDVPEIEVLERKISWFRNHAEGNPQEKPWSMATLDEYPIPPEAIPAVLKVWKSYFANRADVFTIRQARWAARLSVIEVDTEKLAKRARVYAYAELLCHLLGYPFDSGALDRVLMGLPLTGCKSSQLSLLDNAQELDDTMNALATQYRADMKVVEEMSKIPGAIWDGERLKKEVQKTQKKGG